MDKTDIAILTGLARSSITKILSGHGNGYCSETINHIKNLKNIKINYTDLLFSKPEFKFICQTIIDESSPRDSKNIVKVIRFANKCFRRHKTLLKEIDETNTTSKELNIKETFGPYYEDTKLLIMNELFIEMCEIAIKKNHQIREFADLLLDVVEILNSFNQNDTDK